METNLTVQAADALSLPPWSSLPDIGLYMDQVMTLMERAFGKLPGAGEITKSMVNNYVKAGLIRRPVSKKYDRDQLAQLIMIGVLKQAITLEEISRVMAPLCEESVEAGYRRFCAEASWSGVKEGDCPVVSAAIQAARLVIHARALIAQMDMAGRK